MDAQSLIDRVKYLTLSPNHQFTPMLVLKAKPEFETNVPEIGGRTRFRIIYKLDESSKNKGPMVKENHDNADPKKKKVTDVEAQEYL